MKPKILFSALLCFTFFCLSCFANQPAFRKNTGQWSKEILYRFTTSHNQLSFTKNAVIRSHKLPETQQFITYTTQFLDANRQVTPSGQTPLPAKIHYLKTQNSTTDFESLTYRELYPGIDAKYYIKGHALEYDLIIHPKSDPKQIKIKIDGIKQIELSPEGHLLLHSPLTTLTESAPVAYQMINGRQIPVSTQYSLSPQGIISFDFPEGYDPELPLTIDPVILEWGTYLGGRLASNLGGRLENLTVDADGFIFGCGTFMESFPTTPGVHDTTFNGGAYTTSWNEVYASDAVIFKLDPTGSQLIWSTYLGGTRGDVAKDIKLGPNGKVYIAGWTDSPDFPTTPGVLQEDHSGFVGIDGFVARLSADGSNLEVATLYGGIGDDYVWALDVNSKGETFVSGFTNGGDIPTTSGAFDETFNGAQGFADLFVFRLNADMSQLIYSTYVGGNESESAMSIAINDQDEAFVTGEVNSPNFPTTPGAFQDYRLGISSSAFALRLSADGSRLIYSTYIGGTRADHGESLTINENNEAYITGRTQSFDWPTTSNAIDSTWNGGDDVFIAKVSADGTQLLYNTYFGDTLREVGSDIALDRNGNIFVTGHSASQYFPTTACTYDSTHNGGGGLFWYGDLFLMKLTPNGDQLLYSTLLGGISEDGHARLTLDERNCSTEVVLAATSRSPDFPTTPGSYSPDRPGPTNNFVFAKLRETAEPQITITPDSCPALRETLEFSAEIDTCGNWTAPGQWVWDFGDGNSASGLIAQHSYSETGTFSAGLRRWGCPINTIEAPIRILGLDLGADQTVCAGTRAYVIPDHRDAVSWLWENGSTLPKRYFDETGEYILQMTDSAGCTVSDTLNIKVLDVGAKLTNVFSPNGDQINDALFFQDLGTLDWELSVFDRWGTRHYFSEAYQNDWQAPNLKPGVYYYILRGPEECGTFKGTATLIR